MSTIYKATHPQYANPAQGVYVQQPDAFQAPNPYLATAGKVSTVIIQNDQNQSALKGIFWAFATMKLGSATLGAAGATLVTTPFVVTPLIFIPVGCGLATAILGTITQECFNNASYHLGSPSKVVVLHN